MYGSNGTDVPYTFGAATTDDITFGTGQGALASNSTWVVFGWYLPTTLTAGRTLYSAGSTANCAVIGATTSELELLTAFSTTQGKWTTSGLGLTINVWRYIAIAISVHDTGPLMSCRVWAGSISTVPVEISVSQTTAPAGTATSSGTWYIGNKGTGSLAFQGDIDMVDFGYGAGTGINSTLLMPAANGSITQAEADLFLALFVIPIWTGDHAAIDRGRGNVAQGSTAKWFIDMSASGASFGRPANISDPEVALTINGATASKNACPRPPISRPGWPLRRR